MLRTELSPSHVYSSLVIRVSFYTRLVLSCFLFDLVATSPCHVSFAVMLSMLGTFSALDESHYVFATISLLCCDDGCECFYCISACLRANVLDRELNGDDWQRRRETATWCLRMTIKRSSLRGVSHSFLTTTTNERNQRNSTAIKERQIESLSVSSISTCDTYSDSSPCLFGLMSKGFHSTI